MKIAHGDFHGVAHETKGMASVYQLPEGKKVLRFSGFETSNGPDVQVYLVAAPDAKDNETVTRAGFIRIGDAGGFSVVRTEADKAQRLFFERLRIGDTGIAFLGDQGFRFRW